MPEPPISPGSALAALRKVKQRNCLECGLAFETVGRRLRCDKCRLVAAQRTWRERQRAKKVEENS